MATTDRISNIALEDALAIAGMGCWVCEQTADENSAFPQFRISANFHLLLGCSATELPDTKEAWLILAHPADRPAFSDLFEMLANADAQINSHFTLRLRHQSGAWAWFEVRQRHRQDLLNSVAVITFTEITQHKQTEAALRDSQLRYRALYSTSPLAFILWDRQGQITEWNRRAEMMFGWPSNEVIGKAVHRLLLPPDQHEEFRLAIKTLTQGSNNAEFTGTALRKDGSLRHCTWYSVALRTPQGNLIGILSLVLDITEEKLAQQSQKQYLEEQVLERTKELELAHDSLAKIIDGSPVPTFVLNAEHQITHWNKACESVIGIPATQMIGTNKQWQAFYNLPRPVLADLVMTREIELVEKLYQSKYRRSRLIPDGFEAEDYFPAFNRWLFFTAAPLRGPQGNIIGAIETLQDVSERKQAEIALLDAKQIAETAAKTKAEFLANMSHEIRTPMNAVIGLAHLLRKSELSKKQHDYVTRIQGAGEILLRLINDVLDFSKIEAGRMQLETTEFTLDTVLSSVTMVVLARAQEKGLELHYVVEPDVPRHLIGDPLRLTQILVNLLGNAIKFTAKGSVTVFIRKSLAEKGKLLLEVDVQDTGIGMTLEQQATLFQAFTQADNSITRSYGGTGLGLTISKRLVEMMQGRIWVTSQANIGSTFSFQVLLGVVANNRALSAPDAVISKPRRALVVDDNPLARTVLSRLLERFGYQISTTDSGQAALEILQTENDTPFEYVTIDLNMPEMSGLTLAHRIRSLPSISPKLVLVTATETHAMDESGELQDFDCVLHKPVTAAQIEEILNGAQAIPKTDFSRNTSPLQGLRLLLAEDNPTNQLIATEMLQALGMTVDCVENGQLAVATMAAHGKRFDMILMDMQMPEMDGLEATRQIRKQFPALNIPIIAMTAHALDEEKARCMAAGMNDFITKPVDPGLLETTLLRWMPASNKQATKVAPPVAPEVGQETSMPDLPGIDTSTGLRRMMNKWSLYERVLRDFNKRFAGEAAVIRAALVAHDIATAERHAHSTKGLAGSIGAIELQAAALKLEEAIRRHDSYPEMELQSYEEKLSIVINGISAAFPAI